MELWGTSRSSSRARTRLGAHGSNATQALRPYTTMMTSWNGSPWGPTPGGKRCSVLGRAERARRARCRECVHRHCISVNQAVKQNTELQNQETLLASREWAKFQQAAMRVIESPAARAYRTGRSDIDIPGESGAQQNPCSLCCAPGWITCLNSCRRRSPGRDSRRPAGPCPPRRRPSPGRSRRRR